MKIKLLIFLLLSICLIELAYATCTVNLDKTTYAPGEISTAEMICSAQSEVSQSYTLIWVNDSDATVLETDTGTTPSTKNEHFYDTYTFSSTYQNNSNISAQLSGTELEGFDNATVLGASTSALIITSANFGGGYIGLISSIKALVYDENDKKISGGLCKFSVWSNDENDMIYSDSDRIFDGEIKFKWIMKPSNFDEGTEYATKILCYCGSDSSDTECIDEDGNTIEDSIGSLKFPTNTYNWLRVNTLTDKSEYEMKNEIFVCANITNVNRTSRIPIDISHQVRCSKDSDSDSDLDRVLIISDDNEPDQRGISSNKTQMQCKRFIFPESKYLQGRNSECYASTTVWVLNKERKRIMNYVTTSPVFNITSDELNLFPDWQRREDYVFNSIINLSDKSFSDYNGSGIGDIDLKLEKHISSIASDNQYDEVALDISDLLDMKYIKNIIVTNSSGIAESYNLEYLEDGSIEIEIKNVHISTTGWYNVTLELNNFEERQTEALENSSEALRGIETKTGTFHLDVNCPASATIGQDMTCSITAYIEDDQIVQKEVDFTCYISDGLNTYSSVNFNQMITKTPLTLNKNFLVPSSFSDSAQYVLQCTADYYNLGSRRDSFYDTFSATTIMIGRGGYVWPEEPEEPEEKKPSKITGWMVDIIKEFPISPKMKVYVLFIIIIFLIVLGFSWIIDKKKKFKKIKKESKKEKEKKISKIN